MKFSPPPIIDKRLPDFHFPFPFFPLRFPSAFVAESRGFSCHLLGEYRDQTSQTNAYINAFTIRDTISIRNRFYLRDTHTYTLRIYIYIYLYADVISLFSRLHARIILRFHFWFIRFHKVLFTFFISYHRRAYLYAECSRRYAGTPK